MIILQLEQLGGDPAAIELKCKPIATLFLWLTRLETADESWRLHNTCRQLFELRDRIHLASPGPAVYYLVVLLSCTNVNGDRVTTRPGQERVAGVASVCLLRALSGVGPESNLAEGMRQRYIEGIPYGAEFEGPLRHTKIAIHALLIRSQERQSFGWIDHEPCTQDHASFANTLIQAAYNRRKHGRVPRWVLRFALHFLSRDPPPPTSLVADCLTIVAIDLDCDVTRVESTTLDERCVCI